MAKKSNKQEIKKAPVKKVKGAPKVNLIDFDVWYSRRVSLIPPIHHKEILKADFAGRGLSSKETQETFDEALGKYGIKI